MPKDSNQLLLTNLQHSLASDYTFNLVLADFTTTFQKLGCGSEDLARSVALYVISQILRAKKLADAEKAIKSYFNHTVFAGNKKIFDLIATGLATRVSIIVDEVKPHLQAAVGPVLDYGCGDGRVAQTLHDQLHVVVQGIDVRNFKAAGVSIPLKKFAGGKVPVKGNFYEYAVMTNVMHHELNNEKIIKELSRIVAKKLVIIETVPEANTAVQAKKDWGRMLLNDTLWNRFFNYADIPVPGTYETPAGWIKRFKKYGWQVAVSEDLGIDQPTIQDRHHLLVFTK